MMPRRDALLMAIAMLIFAVVSVARAFDHPHSPGLKVAFIAAGAGFLCFAAVFLNRWRTSRSR